MPSSLFLMMEGLTLVASSGKRYSRDLVDGSTADTQPIFPFFSLISSFFSFSLGLFWRITSYILTNFFNISTSSLCILLTALLLSIFYITSDTTYDQ